MKFRLLAILALALVTSSAAAEMIPRSGFSSGNWNGAAYTNDKSGQFSHCAISAKYVSGNTLYFSVNADASVSVAVVGQLGLTEGQQFPVALYVDRRRPFYGTAQALSSDFALLNIREFEAAMTAFQKGYVLRIEALGGLTEYDLVGTYRALEAARQCARANYRYTAAPQVRDKTAMFQVSTMIISDLGLSDFRYLSDKELRERGWENSVAWTSEQFGVTGLSLIMPAEQNMDLRSTDPADTQFIASGCGGDYATSARSIDLDNSGSARELRLICTEEDRVSETYLSKFLNGNQVVYTVLVFEDANAALPRSAPRPEQSERATIRAARFMSE